MRERENVSKSHAPHTKKENVLLLLPRREKAGWRERDEYDMRVEWGGVRGCKG